ncbi:MAG: winged helix-turn-helix domain-containing protein [Acetobacteraceae bacterium]
MTWAGVAFGPAALMQILGNSEAVVEEFADVPAMLGRLDREPMPNLVVIGWEMPGAPMIEVLGRVRDFGAGTAVLFVGGAPRERRVAGESERSAHDGDMVDTRVLRQNLVQSLELVVTNASGVGTGEALPAVTQPRRRGVVELHLDSCRAYWNGQRVDLSLTEFRIVSRMAASPGVDFSHRDIYDMIKGEGVVSGRGEGGYRGSVRAAIKRIRRKFVHVDRGFSAIRSYHGFGYRWVESAAAEIVGQRREGAALIAG